MVTGGLGVKTRGERPTMNVIFWAQILGVGVAIREDGPGTALRNERAASLLVLTAATPRASDMRPPGPHTNPTTRPGCAAT
jgi:hypothetical protein